MPSPSSAWAASSCCGRLRPEAEVVNDAVRDVAALFRILQRPSPRLHLRPLARSRRKGRFERVITALIDLLDSIDAGPDFDLDNEDRCAAGDDAPMAELGTYGPGDLDDAEPALGWNGENSQQHLDLGRGSEEQEGSLGWPNEGPVTAGRYGRPWGDDGEIDDHPEDEHDREAELAI